MERYEDYLAKKKEDEDAERRRKEEQNQMLFQTPEQNRRIEHPNVNQSNNSPINNVIANTVDVLIKPPEKVDIPLTLKQTHSMNMDQPNNISPNNSDIATL
jgi:hypothetical protein